MSGLWNPYAFSPTGEAVPVGVPPALRIMNGQATSAQLMTAQTMFANFCMHSRLSTVPNATEQGRFTDGSTYRIVTIGGATIMELYPATTGTQTKNVFSGILMEFGTGKEPAVLVNEGETDAPGFQWRLEKVPKNNPAPNGGVAEPVGYNSWAWVESARVLRGKAKYTYVGYPGQYGRRVGYSVPEMFLPTGADDEGRLLAMARIGDSIHTARTMEKANETGWYGLDDLPVTLPLRYFSDEGPIFTAEEDEFISNITASRSGRKISFAVSRYDYFSVADLPPDRMLTVSRAVPFFARAGVNGAGEVFIDNAARGVGTEGSVYMLRGYELDMYTSTLGQAGFSPASVEWTMPADTIDPPQETIGWADNINNRVFFYFPERTSVRITGLTKPKFDVDGNGGGPFGYRATRSEDTRSLIGLNYVSHEMLARVVVVRNFNYEQEQRGGHSAQWDAATGRTTGTVESSSTTSTATAVSEYADLAGTRLYLRRDTYRATSTRASLEVRRLVEYPGGWGVSLETTVDSSMEYTADRECRHLYVYDPALDLVCYSEITFGTSWSGSASSYFRGRVSGNHPPEASSSSLSAGPEFLTGIPFYFVIECRGAVIRIPVPGAYIDALSDIYKKLFYASFFPNSGVAPTTPPNVAVRTPTGFAHHPVDATSVFSPDEPDYIENGVICFSGMCPEIDAPGNIRVLYRKTPETGGGFLDISSEKGEFSHRFLIDFSGARRAESVVPDLPPTPWGNNARIF